MTFIALPECEKRILIDAVNALEPFAEAPSIQMDHYPCHVGLTDKYHCGRCSRAINAYGVMVTIELWLSENE